MAISGFVQLEKGEQNKDIEIQLCNEYNQVIDRSISTEDGFYLLPILNKDNYLLRITANNQEYTFQPQQIDIPLRGKTDKEVEEILSTSYDFTFKGYNLQLDVGGKGLKVQLDKQQEISGVDGKVVFRGLARGNYTIRVEDNQEYQLKKGSNSISCQVGAGHPKCTGVIQVASYRVQLRLVDQYDRLITDYKLDAVKSVKGVVDLGFRAIGTHMWKLQIEGQKLDSDQLQVAVLDSPVDQVKQISIQHWNQKGRVLDLQGLGLAGVRVQLQDNYSLTDQQGYYQFKGVKEGEQQVHLNKTGYLFEQGLKRTVNGLDSQLESFQAVGVQCVVRLEMYNQQYDQIDVQLISAGAIVQQIQQKQDSYVLDLVKGKVYSVQVTINHKGQTVSLRESSVQIKEVQKPLQLVFKRKQRIVSGLVQGSHSGTKVYLESKGKKEQLQLDSQGKFNKIDLEKGQYMIRVEDNEHCYQKQQQQVVVDEKEEQEVLFNQIGYYLYYEATGIQKLDLQYKETVETIEVENKGRVCVKQQKYMIEDNQCYRLAVQNKTQRVLKVGSKIINKIPVVKDYRISQVVAVVGQMSTQVKQQVLKGFSIQVIDNRGNKYPLAHYNSTLQVSAQSLHYSYWIANSSQVYINYTSQIYNQNVQKVDNQQVDMSKGGCQVLPQLEVQVIRRTVVKLDKDLGQSYQVILRDQKGKLLETVTSQTQSLDLLNDQLQKVELVKAGYLFHQTVTQPDPLNTLVQVRVVKLSQLKVQVKDQQGNILEGVNVFVSSMNKDDQKRQNLLTDDQGLSINSNIMPGKYLVKPVLMEYKFNPIQQIVNIQQGQHLQLDIIGTKYLFSLYGKVKDLASNPLPGVQLQVYQQQEQGINKYLFTVETNQQGVYRVQGLEHLNTYQIKLDDQINLTQFLDNNRILTIQNQDLFNQDYFAVLSPTTQSLQLLLDYDQYFQPEEIEEIIRNKIKVTVYNQDMKELDKQVLQVNRVLQIRDIEPNQAYTVNIKIKLGNYVIDRNQVFLPGVYQQVMQMERQSNDHKQGSIMGTVMVILLIIGIFNYQTTQKLMNKIFRS